MPTTYKREAITVFVSVVDKGYILRIKRGNVAHQFYLTPGELTNLQEEIAAKREGVK